MNFTKKLPVVAIALLTCQSCMIIPVPVPVSGGESIPDIVNIPDIVKQFRSEFKKSSSYCPGLTETEGREVTGELAVLEREADYLAANGEHEEALKKYNEARAALLIQYLPSLEEDESQNIEAYVSKYKEPTQKEAELAFKVGLTYAELNKPDIAIKCFNQTLKEHIGIAPPNNAAALLNRGDAYLKLGDKDKARQDYEEAAKLFEEYKLPAYKKRALDKLQNANAQ